MDEYSDESSRVRLLGRYFLHGILYSIVALGLVFVLSFVIVGLVVVGLWIGLIIGFILLFLVIGGINVFLMNVLWNISVESNLLSLFLHGLSLAVAFLVVSIPVFIINVFVPSVATTIVLFIVYCFIDGYVAKNVATVWEEGYVGDGEE
jgi:hypothetical protein